MISKDQTDHEISLLSLDVFPSGITNTCSLKGHCGQWNQNNGRAVHRKKRNRCCCMMMLTMVPAMTVFSVMITIVTHASERKMRTGK